MGSSPGFGSTAGDWGALFGLAFATAPAHRLNLATDRNSPVEDGSDELWVGVKCQSYLEIAGSPRNSFRASLGWCFAEVEH